VKRNAVVYFGGHFVWSIFRASLGKFGQKSFARPKISLLLHPRFLTPNVTNLLTNVCFFKQTSNFKQWQMSEFSLL